VTYHNSPDGKLSQGDIFRRVRVITNIVGGTNNGPKYGESNIVVITRSCEIDKDPNSVLVARIARLKSQSERIRGLIRGDGEKVIVNAFYLPPGDQLMEESYVDWRTLQPLSKEMMEQLRLNQDYYKCTLDEEMRKACLESFIVFFTKPEDEENQQLEDV